MSSARSGGCRQRACCRPGAAVPPPSMSFKTLSNSVVPRDMVTIICIYRIPGLNIRN